MVNTIDKARKIIDAYAYDTDGLTQEECLDVGFSSKQCNVLTSALGTGAEGGIMMDEWKGLIDAGFSGIFVSELAGCGGKKALMERVKWLGENIDSGWWPLNRSDDQRSKVIRELGDIGADSKETVPALIRALKDDDSRIRIGAIYTLGNIGPTAAPAIPILVEMFRDWHFIVAQNAAIAVGKIGPAAIPALLKVIKGNDKGIRRYAIFALGEFGPAAADSIPDLIDVLSDTNDELARQFVARALGNMGTLAISAIPELIKALAYGSGDVRYSAAEALAKIGASAIPALITILKGHNLHQGARDSAIRALGMMGEAAAPAVPALIEIVENDNFYGVRWSAIELLGKIGPAAFDAIPNIITKAVTINFGDFKYVAREALVEIGPTAVPYLIEELHNKDKDVRLRILTMLHDFDVKDIFPAILELEWMIENDSSTEVREDAAELNQWIRDNTR